MRAYLYRVGVWILAIVISYSFIFNILPNFQKHISHIILKDGAFSEPFKQPIVANSRVFLTFFDKRNFVELKMDDDDSDPCVTTTLQVIIIIIIIIIIIMLLRIHLI